MAKKVTITAIVPDDTNQNDLKTWVKTCPFSLEGDQTVTWENLPEPEKAIEEQAAPADAAIGETEGEKAA